MPRSSILKGIESGLQNQSNAYFFNRTGPYVCTGCCSQEISLHVAGSRSYVSGLLIDTRVVAMLGLRSHRDLISGQVQIDRMGRQILGA